MAATLSVPYLGTREERARQARSTETITIQLPLRSVSLERNDINHADSCTVKVDWRDTTLDPRMLDDGVLTVYIGNADDFGNWEPSEKEVQFIGHIQNPERHLDSESPATLEIEALDYTSLFLKANPFGSSGVPEYSLTLDQAWRKIVSQTPGADVLADRLVGIGVDPKAVTLGKAVAPRFAKLAQVPVHPRTDAWAVWLQCVGMLGLLSFFDLDRCIVTTSTDYYTEKDPPRLRWGKDIKSLDESRQAIESKNGIALTSFDPLTGRTIEAIYPPKDDERVLKKRLKAKKVNQDPESFENEKRDVFEFWGVTDPGMLLEIAKRVYEERSRQELAGKAATSELWVDRVSKERFDLLKLRSGDVIRVELGDNERQFLTSLPTEAARIFYLVDRGYSSSVAIFLARNVEAFSKFDATFYVQSVKIDLEVDGDAGDFTIDIDFVNRIQVDSGAIA